MTAVTRTHRDDETTSQEIKARYSGELTKSNEKVQGLQKSVKRLKAYVGGEAKRTEREVQKAIKQVIQGAGSLKPHRVKVKTPQGVVEDWVCDLICVMAGKHGTPYRGCRLPYGQANGF